MHAITKSSIEKTAELISSTATQSPKVLSFILEFANSDKTRPTLASERAQLAMELYQNRRARDRLFDGELFADPAWDILLVLYCALHAQQRLSVSSVCISAAVPPTTAMRWIATLCEREFIGRAKSPLDGRVTWLYLAGRAAHLLDRYLDGILENQHSMSPARAA